MAQFGIFFTLCMAGMFSPDFRDYFSIAIIGAADGPTSIAVANKLDSNYVGQIASVIAGGIILNIATKLLGG